MGRSIRAGYGLTHWHEHVRGAWFVEDGLWHAHSLCPQHVEAGLSMYTAPLRAEIEVTGKSVKWLDLQATTKNLQVTIALHDKNQNFRDGAWAEPSQHLLPWWCERDKTLQRRYFWFLSSRAYRLQAIHQGWSTAVHQIVDIALEACKFGAPPRFVLACLNKLHKIWLISQVIRQMRRK